jgi:nitrite reductase/ring-hydroxylating ferredoxin subunit
MAFKTVAHVSQIPEGRLLAVRVDGEDVVLYNVKGRLHASRDWCPHAGYPLSQSRLQGKYVRCSLHDWEFDVTTGVYTANPNIHLRCYAVKVEGDDVLLDLAPLPPPPPPPPPSLSRDDV